MELLGTGTSESIWVHKVGRHGFGVVVLHIDVSKFKQENQRGSES